jgi:hypothetical protein
MERPGNEAGISMKTNEMSEKSANVVEKIGG